MAVTPRDKRTLPARTGDLSREPGWRFNEAWALWSGQAIGHPPTGKNCQTHDGPVTSMRMVSSVKRSIVLRS
ncbi:hypothetical protein [Rhodopseudomonas sp. RCAM05734]|uniref:hypothetical protein n=1 Tax=Rhodopseudomonas sp. RCAM05734 TaxID=3457549 RepID=UPI00404468BE